MKKHLNAETEGKSREAAMTAKAATANPNWMQRRARPPRVPGMPSMSFILTMGATSPTSVVGASSTGWIDPWLVFISLPIMQSINSFLLRPYTPQFDDHGPGFHRNRPLILVLFALENNQIGRVESERWMVIWFSIETEKSRRRWFIAQTQ